MPRRKSSTSFGEPGANPSGAGRRKPPPQPYIAPPEDGAPQQLQDLRHVYLNGQEHDSTMGHAIARGILKKDTAKFLELLTKLEREHKANAPDGGEEPVDEGGTAKCIALCEELIAKLVGAERN